MLPQTAFAAGAAATASSPTSGADAMAFFTQESGVLTQVSKEYVPSSVTTITEEDIRVTPAKNIYDLLEVYVPGAIMAYHNESNHVGIRGLISDRDNRTLLLVNGVEINQNVHSGAVDELMNWDLSDIKEIKVIRGPGSVTYGPGAIEGVINIITYDDKSDPGLHIGGQAVSEYGSNGGHASYGSTGDNFSSHVLASVTKTAGHTERDFQTDVNGNAGFIGGSGTTPNPADEYLRDFNNHPQIKLDAKFDFLKEWSFWSRYNDTGGTFDPTTFRALDPLTGLFDYERQQRNRYFLSSLQDNHSFSDDLKLKSKLTYRTYDHVLEQSTLVAGTGPGDAINNKYAYGADDWMVDLLANYKLTEKHDVSVGVSYIREDVGAGWNRNPRDMRLGDGTNIVSGPDNNVGVTPATALYAGNGWYTNTYSLLSEGNFKFSPKANVILSARLDKNDYTGYLFSPRAAFVSDQDRAGIYKLIIQQALRMDSSEQLWQSHQAGNAPATEKMRGVEFIWDSPKYRDSLTLNSSVFYNELNALGWNTGAGKEVALGDEKLAGIELEAKYEKDHTTIGANHSFTKQISFARGADLNNNLSYISYADANLNVAPGETLHSTGNDLNNWANNTTKLYVRQKLMQDRLILHGDTRVNWGWQGKLDSLAMYENAAAGTAAGPATTSNVAALMSHDVYDIQVRVDASVTYKTDQFSVTLWGQNLLSNDKNLRYSLDAGVSKVAPVRNDFLEEPTIFGLRLDYKIGNIGSLLAKKN